MASTRRSRLGSALRRVPVVFGLTAVAVTQPVFDLLGSNPQFFVAANLSGGQIVVFALLVVLVPGLVVAAVVVGAELLDERIGAVVYSLAVGGLVAVLVLAVARLAGFDRVLTTVVPAVAIGAALALFERRSAPLTQLLTYLALAQVAFLGLFLFASPTSALIIDDGGSPDDERGTVSVADGQTPVVFLVLDELPLTTLLRADGSLNSDRFPGFGRLADESTWFRNTSSVFARTHIAIPALLTGVRPDGDTLPVYDEQPRNVFTLLGPTYDVDAYELVTDLCPDDICDPRPAGSLGPTLSDAVVAYSHRILPARFRDDLPRIDTAWGGFGDSLDLAPVGEDLSDPVDALEAAASVIGDDAGGDPYAKWKALGRSVTGPGAQAQALGELISGIPAEPGFSFVHVAMPHFPWVLTPFGARNSVIPAKVDDPDDPAYDFAARHPYQMQSMQVGVADQEIGRLVDRLQDLGIWDDALVVVVSDHGSSTLPPDYGRRLTDTNREDVLRVPLFIKQPGQRRGEIRDDTAQTLDVLPSIADLLGIETDWETDGHSLFDGSTATTEPVVSPSVEPLLQLAERHAARFGGRDDWVGLAAFGELGDLVGMPLDRFDVADPSPLRWTTDQADQLLSLPTEDGAAPFVLTGQVIGSDDRPDELLLVVNGTVAGIAGGFQPVSGGRYSYSAFLADFFVDGPNTAAMYEVDRTGGTPTLHQLGVGG